MRLYHRAELGLRPGQEVKPGRWWRLVTSIPGHKCLYHLALVEAVRQAEFPNRPSHRESTFAMTDPADAKDFRATDALYLVIADPTVMRRGFRGDMGWDDVLHDRELPIERHVDAVRAYWRSEPAPRDSHWELVLPGSLRIVRVLAPPARPSLP